MGTHNDNSFTDEKAFISLINAVRGLSAGVRVSKTRLRRSLFKVSYWGKRKGKLGILQPGAGAGPTEDTAAVCLDRDDEVKGKHSNSNWKQTGARGTAPVGTAQLSCLQQ